LRSLRLMDFFFSLITFYSIGTVIEIEENILLTLRLNE